MWPGHLIIIRQRLYWDGERKSIHKPGEYQLAATKVIAKNLLAS